MENLMQNQNATDIIRPRTLADKCVMLPKTPPGWSNTKLARIIGHHLRNINRFREMQQNINQFEVF